MVLPDGEPDTGRTTKHSKRALVGGTALVIGLIALLSLTRPDPALVAALAETTTTSPSTTTTVDLTRPIDFDNFTVDQIARGERFEWEKVLDLDDHWGLDMIWTGGRLHVFALDEFPYSSSPAPISHWITEDGWSWATGAAFGSYIRYSNVTRVPDGLAIAAGHENGITLAISRDGLRWEESEIEIDVGEFTSVAPGPIAVTEALQVIAFNEYLALEQSLMPMIESHLGIQLLNAHGSIAWRPHGATDIAIDVLGPFGIRLAQLYGSELGLDPGSLEQANQRYHGGEGTQVWARSAGGKWQRSEIPGIQWLESLVPLPDGSVLAAGYTSDDSTHWVSSDGLSWSVADTRAPVQITALGDAYLGISSELTNQILVSRDGRSWEALATEDLLPRRTDLQFTTVAGGPGGIATTAFTLFHPPPSSGPMDLADLGAMGDVTIDARSRTVTLTVDGEAHHWRLSGLLTPDWVSVDLEHLDLKFSHPESGDLLATVALNELRSMEEDHAMRWGRLQHSAFLFTRDGSDWSIRDLSPVTNDANGWVTDIAVGQDGVYLLVQHRDGGFTVPNGFSVWKATIP